MPNSSAPQSTCAVSVVIPMYNAEKYIAALLESLLAQTFQNFEVIVVDDRSTDKSRDVVESYKPRFNGRLKLLRMKKNSGGPGAPINKGIAHAGGKYIFQADNDDLLMNNALEVLYNTAEASGADVVHTTGNFLFRDNPEELVPDVKNLLPVGYFLEKPSFLPNDTGGRIKLFCKNVIEVPGWLKFVRRDLLVKNGIIFQENVKASQDIMWTIELIFYAKSYLLITNRLYIYREHNNSVSNTERRGAETIKYRGRLLVKNVEFLCKFFGKEKFFSDNPQCAWMLLDWLESRYSNFFCEALCEVPPHDAQKILAEDFAADFGKHAGLIAYLCTSANFSRLKEKFYIDKLNARAQ